MVWPCAQTSARRRFSSSKANCASGRLRISPIRPLCRFHRRFRVAKRKKPLVYIPESWRKKIRIGFVVVTAALIVGLILIFLPKGQSGSQGAATDPSSGVVTMAPDGGSSQDSAQPTQKSTSPTLEPYGPTQEPGGSTQGAGSLPSVGEVFYRHLAAGTQYSAALNLDGTVSVYGGENSQIYASDWNNIVQIAGYGDLLVGLRSDGTVVATGTDTKHLSGEYQGWQSVQAIEAGYQSVSALSADGYVLYDGTDYQSLNACENWQNVTLLVRGDEHMVGVTANGTLLGVGMNNVYQINVSGVTNVLNAATSCQTTYILKRDGTVQLVGGNKEYEQGQASAANWSGVIAITSGDRHVIGLRQDGNVLYAGDNSYGQCNVGKWTNIIAVCAGHRHTIAIDSDGTLHMTGSNKYGQTAGDGDSILR